MPTVCNKCGAKIPAMRIDGTAWLECPVCRSPLQPNVPPVQAAPTNAPLPIQKPPPPPVIKSLPPVVSLPPPATPPISPWQDEEQYRRLTAQMPPWLALLLAILFSGMALLMAIMGYVARAEKQASTSWPTTPGTITSCELREIRSKPRRLPYEIVSYTVEVTYDFQVAGEDYEGTRIVYSDNTWKLDSAEARAAKYTVGSTHPVFYNPAAPQRCLLEPGDTYEGDTQSVDWVMGVWLPIGLMVIAPLFVWIYWMGRRFQQREANRARV